MAMNDVQCAIACLPSERYTPIKTTRIYHKCDGCGDGCKTCKTCKTCGNTGNNCKLFSLCKRYTIHFRVFNCFYYI